MNTGLIILFGTIVAFIVLLFWTLALAFGWV